MSSDWSNAFKQSLKRPTFAIVLVVLLIGAIGIEGASRTLQLHFRKEAMPLRDDLTMSGAYGTRSVTGAACPASGVREPISTSARCTSVRSAAKSRLITTPEIGPARTLVRSIRGPRPAQDGGRKRRASPTLPRAVRRGQIASNHAERGSCGAA